MSNICAAQDWFYVVEAEDTSGGKIWPVAVWVGRESGDGTTTYSGRVAPGPNEASDRRDLQDPPPGGHYLHRDFLDDSQKDAVRHGKRNYRRNPSRL